MSVCESWAWQLRLLRATHRARGWRGNTVALCALVWEYEERHGEEVVCTSRVPKGVFLCVQEFGMVCDMVIYKGLNEEVVVAVSLMHTQIELY